MNLDNVIHEVIIDYFTNNVNGVNDKLNQITITRYKEVLKDKYITEDDEYAQLIIKGVFLDDNDIKHFNHDLLTDYKDCLNKVQTIINNTINDKIAKVNELLDKDIKEYDFDNLSKEELIDIIKSNKYNKCKE